MLLDEICDVLSPVAAGRCVVDVRIGLGYTAVMLDNGHCGLAHTFRHETGGGCCAFRNAGELGGSSAASLLRYAKSTDVISTAIALATVNALTDPPISGGADDMELLHLKPEDEVGMVGAFGPLIEPLRKRVKTLNVFEKTQNSGMDILPEEAEAEVLPHCHIAIITATTLINRTLDKVLDYCQNAREVMLLGPSTPYVPEVLAKKGVTILAGAHVTDAGKTLRIVSEGGGTMRLKSAMRMYSINISH